MALPIITPTPGAFALSVTSTSSKEILPTSGTPTALVLTNSGRAPIWVALGSTSVVATQTSLIILPGKTVFLAIGANTYIAAIGVGDETNSLYAQPTT